MPIVKNHKQSTSGGNDHRNYPQYPSDADIKGLDRLQRLASATFRAEALMDKVVAFLNKGADEEFSDIDLIEDIPAVIAELHMNVLRITALLPQIKRTPLSPDTLEQAVSNAVQVLGDAIQGMSAIDHMFHKACGLDEEAIEDEDECECGCGCECEFDEDEECDEDCDCDISIEFPEGTSEIVMDAICSAVEHIVTRMYKDFGWYGRKNPDEKCGKDADKAEGTGLNLDEMSAAELCSLQQIITKKINERINPF